MNQDDKMMGSKKFKFSIIISIYNMEEYLNEAIDSIIHQTMDFTENTELILIDDGSTDNSKNIALDYFNKYPENVKFISIPNQGQGRARNIGIDHIRGKYVNFLDADDYLSNNALDEIWKFFEENNEETDIVSIPLMLFGRENKDHRLNYKYKTNRIIDLEEEPNNPQLSASSAFIKVEALGELRFSENVISSEDAILINKILLKRKKLGVINTAQYFYRQRYDQTSTIDNSIYNKEYYTERLKNYFLELIEYSLSKEGHVPEFIQYILAYDFQWLFKLDSLDIFENKDERDEFKYFLNKIAKNICDDAIIHNKNIEERFKSFFMFIKNNEFSMKLDESGKLLLKTEDYLIDQLNKHHIYLDHIEIIEKELVISGFIASNFNYDYMTINAVCKSEDNIIKYKAKQFKYLETDRNIRTFLGIDWRFCFNFDVKIPITDKETEISFEINYNENNIDIKFNPIFDLTPNCGLSTSSSNFIKFNKIVLYKKGLLYILPYSYKSLLRFEYSNIKKIIRDKKPNYINALFIRFLFITFYPIYKNKNIWLFADRPNLADDNGIQLFKYSLSRNEKNIDKYFIIDKNNSNYNEIKEISSNIIQYKSLKHKMLFLFSKKVICSYVNDEFINPIDQQYIELYEGMITTEKYFLQHGIIKDDVSLHINRFKKNLRLFLTSSDLEKDSIIYGKYNYDNKIVKALGLPRYDNLNSSEKLKKDILFMPTWRIGISSKESFVNSDYFKELDFILNNNEFINMIEEKGYRLVFKPHPELEKFIDYLKINNNIKISTNVKYQKLFNESSLLITDYSSVFFDFAYLKKPVIYFQTNEYHYSEGYFNYETMGFGDIAKTNEDLLKKVNFYLDKECNMEDKFQKRVNHFYKYHDKNNSKRVYDWILKN